MKFLSLIIIAFSMNSAFAWPDCTTYEAQVKSVIKTINPHYHLSNACWVTLDINLSQPGQHFDPGQLCPLSIDEVWKKEILVEDCGARHIGDEISGYIVKREEILVLE